CYVALGVIPKAVFPSEQLRHQFEAEVLIANSIHHPNVASTFPLEVVNDSYLYAMEFCNGEALAARTRQSGSVEPLEAMEITRQIAASLEAASSAGLLHRNITADDIIVLEEDDEILVKVCGLGLPA